MSSLINNGMIRLFEKLPFLPLCQISKHLNACAIVTVAMYSENWEKALRKRRNKTSVWELRVTKDQIYFWIAFTDKAQSFFVKSAPELMEKLDKPFSKGSQLKFFTVLKLLSQFFPPTSYGNIFVSLEASCPDFPFRLLSRFPRGSARQVHIEGDLEVNGPDLVKFLEKVKMKDREWYIRQNNRLSIQVKIKNLATSDKICFENDEVNIRDARFLTRGSTLKLGTFLAEIGVNNFTSQDLNAFLKSWMKDGMQNIFGSSLCTIDIREDQNIKLEEMMEGLNVHSQRTRDRWHIHLLKNNDILNIKVTDMNGGLDISNWQGTLGTVLLEPNQFTFVTWNRGFTWDFYENEMRKFITRYGDYISTNRRTLELLQNPNGRHGYSDDVLQSKISERREKIEKWEQDMARYCEIYQKLITEWKND